MNKVLHPLLWALLTAIFVSIVLLNSHWHDLYDGYNKPVENFTVKNVRRDGADLLFDGSFYRARCLEFDKITWHTLDGDSVELTRSTSRQKFSLGITHTFKGWRLYNVEDINNTIGFAFHWCGSGESRRLVQTQLWPPKE